MIRNCYQTAHTGVLTIFANHPKFRHLNISIITESPWWLVTLCILAGVAYSVILYYRDSRFSDVSAITIRVMAVFRFLSVFILCFLLMSPLIKTVQREVEKPVLVFLQDGSSSVISAKDSSSLRVSYGEKITGLLNSLSDDFDVRTYTIGAGMADTLSFDFNGAETDLSDPVSNLRARYTGRNLGAVILSSDGLYNKGQNPLYSYPELNAPVYTVGMGDTTIFRDLMIRSVNHNKTAFLGNTFPVEVTFDARKCSGENIQLVVSRKDQTIISRNLQISNNRFNAVVPVFMDANEKGSNKYTVRITELDGELTYENNVWDFYIDVIDNKQVILCLAGSPHPDLAAIRSAVESNPGYEFRMMQASDFDGNLSGINLAILHQLPSSGNNASALIEKLSKQSVPVWFILGSQTSVQGFNNLQAGVKISEHRGNTTEIMADVSRDFSVFSTDDEFARRISGFPPLISPFGNYSRTGEIQVLFNQKVGQVKTEMPLMWFNTAGNEKMAFLAGEGIWKWRLREFAEHGNHDITNSFISKTIQFLSSKDIKTPFRVFYKKSFTENEPVIMDAEFYNETGELVNTPEVLITISDEEGRSYPYSFSRTGQAYNLNAGYLPSGIYKFTATAKSESTSRSFTGTFTITALQAEKSETVADHGLLRALAAKTGGSFTGLNSLESLADELKSRNDIKPVSYMRKKLDDVINVKWFFAIIMLLLATEWFLRKRNGSY